MWASANRDEAVFGDPDEFRLDCGSAQSAQRVRKPNERKQFACAMLRGAWCQLQGFLGHFRDLPADFPNWVERTQRILEYHPDAVFARRKQILTFEFYRTFKIGINAAQQSSATRAQAPRPSLHEAPLPIGY